MSMPVYLTARDVALRAGVSPTYAHLWVRAGRIPVAGRTLSGITLFRAEDVERWLTRWEQCRRRPYRHRIDDIEVAGLDYGEPSLGIEGVPPLLWPAIPRALPGRRRTA